METKEEIGTNAVVRKPKLAVKIVGGIVLGLVVLTMLLLAVGKTLMVTDTGLTAASSGVAASSLAGISVGAPSVNYSDSKSSNVDMGTVSPEIMPVPGGASPTQNKIIKTGSATIETNSAYNTLSLIKTTANGFGAFYENESLSLDSNKNEYASIVIRVPSDKFDAFVKKLNEGSFGKILNMDISQSDQSKTYTDLKARLTSTEKELAAVEEILKKAKTVEEILTIRSQTAALRSEADQLKASINSIDADVRYSTLSLMLQSPDSVHGQTNWWTTTMQTALNSLQGTFSAMVIFLSILFPWALMAGLVYGLYRLIRRVVRSRR